MIYPLLLIEYQSRHVKFVDDHLNYYYLSQDLINSILKDGEFHFLKEIVSASKIDRESK